MNDSESAVYNSSAASTADRESGTIDHGHAANLTSWQRISRTLAFATTRIEPGEPVRRHPEDEESSLCYASDRGHHGLTIVPHVQIPEVPPELKEWTDNTLLGVFAGVSYGGVRHYLHTRREGGIGSSALCQVYQ